MSVPPSSEQPATPQPPPPEPVIEHLHRLEAQVARLVGPAENAGASALHRLGHLVEPAWRRANRGEPRWPASVAVAAVVVLQIILPQRLSLTGRWVLPTVEAVLLLVLVVANPRRIDSTSARLRLVSLAVIAVASVANGWSVARLVDGLVHGTEGDNAAALLATGGSIWLTNVIIFALWYWEFDRGGPASRAAGSDPDPDFLFPQMATPELAIGDWKPEFVDYLYVSFTNATAFSPTDTMPLSRWAKLAMMAQSAVSLIAAALVIARAVNILK